MCKSIRIFDNRISVFLSKVAQPPYRKYNTFAVKFFDMKYQPLSPDFYKNNRQNVVGEMEQNSVAIITSHDEYPRSGDTTFPFRQNPELLYLCGIDQEETTLVLAPWHHDKESREILFIKNPSPEMVVWYGHRLTKEQATAISGIENVMFVEDLESKIHDIIIKSQNIYMHFPENPRSKLTHPTQEFRLIEKLRKPIRYTLIKGWRQSCIRCVW